MKFKITAWPKLGNKAAENGNKSIKCTGSYFTAVKASSSTATLFMILPFDLFCSPVLNDNNDACEMWISKYVAVVHHATAYGCVNNLRCRYTFLRQRILVYLAYFCRIIYGLVKDCSNRSALAMEWLESCNKPSIMCPAYLANNLKRK